MDISSQYRKIKLKPPILRRSRVRQRVLLQASRVDVGEDAMQNHLLLSNVQCLDQSYSVECVLPVAIVGMTLES